MMEYYVAVKRNEEELCIPVWKDLQETVLNGKTAKWNLSIYLHTYIYTHIYVYIYMYVCIYIWRERE